MGAESDFEIRSRSVDEMRMVFSDKSITVKIIVFQV